jgi:putative transcriptional regulator
MAKKQRDVGREILDGLRELKRGEHGRITNFPDVASVRNRTGLSQSKFAELLGVSVRTFQDWEQGRRAPSGAARTLLTIADKDPKVLEAFSASAAQPGAGRCQSV